MHFIKLSLGSLFIAGTLLLTGCGKAPNLDGTSASAGDFVYRGHNFGSNRDADYKRGVKDGCRTSDGDYTKNHALFKSESDYHVGWEHGRMHCKGSAK